MSGDQKDSATAVTATASPYDTDTAATKGSGSDDRDDVRARILEQQAAIQASEPPAHVLSSFWRRDKKKRRDDEIATQPSVFDDPELAPYFQPSERYENRHRFDPSFKWTWGEERRLINRIDWKVTAWSCMAFFALDLDRSNIHQANTDNFLEDLGLGTNDYNLGNTVFTTVFLLSELPSQLISKKIGPDRWIPAQMLLWSLVSGSQFWLRGRGSFLATRALLGLLQGGFIPDVILYLSYFYKGTELPLRLALFWMANRLTDVIAPLLAYGILRLRGVHGQEGWRWLFLIEAILTFVIGLWSVFNMCPSPTQTKAWWRPKGWFTEREEKVMVNRILRDDPSKSDMHNRQAITPKLLWESLCDYDIWPIYIIGLTFGIPSSPPDSYLTLTLKQLGFDTFNSNLLSIPCQMLILTYLSEKINQRAYLGLFTQFWYLPCLISLAVLPTGVNKWASYAVVTVLLSYPSPHPMQVAWCSRNSNTVRTRTVSAALYNMAVQLQSIASYNIYREDDKPEYRRGNRVLIGVNCLNLVIYVAVKVYYQMCNRHRDKVWAGMTAEERQAYLDTTTDKGSKRLDFRFVH